jgi:heme O synthase-like polyprenyltransferase
MGDRSARPLAVRQMNRRESLVFGRRLRKHGVFRVKVAMKDPIVALFAQQTIANIFKYTPKFALNCLI